MDNITGIRYMILTYLYAFWSRRYLIVIIILCSPFLGLILYLFSPGKYEARAALSTYNLSQAFIKDMPTVPNLEEQFAGLKAYVTSPTILKNIAQQTGILSTSSSDNKIEETVQGLSKSISIALIDKNMVEIKVIGDDPKKMIAITNLLNSFFMKEFLKPIITSAQSMSVILQKESEEQKNKLNESIKQLNLSRAEHNNTNPENGDVYKDQLRNIVKSIADSEEKYRDVLTEITWLERSFTETPPEIATLDREINDNDTNLNNMRPLYNESYEGVKSAEELALSLKKERDDLLKNHPLLKVNKMLSPDEFLSPVKLDSLLPEQRTQYLNLQQKINGLKEQINDLNQQKNALLLTIKKVNETQNEQSVFIKSVNNNQAIYNDLLNRYNLAQTMSQLDFANQFKVIKIMALPLEPLPYIGGRPILFYLLIAIFGGLFLSFSLAIILDKMDNTARERKTLETLTDIAVISRFGKIS